MIGFHVSDNQIVSVCIRRTAVFDFPAENVAAFARYFIVCIVCLPASWSRPHLSQDGEGASVSGTETGGLGGGGRCVFFSGAHRDKKAAGRRRGMPMTHYLPLQRDAHVKQIAKLLFSSWHCKNKE